VKEKGDHKVYFKSILTYDAKMWILLDRNKTKIQAGDMTFFRSIKGKT
jgi:hypothetical protein